MNKKIFQFLCAIPLLYSLSSCVSLGGAEAPPAFLVLTPENSVSQGETKSTSAANSLVVLIPSVPRKLDTNRIPVQINDSSIAYIQGAYWADKPARLMQQLLSETVTATTGQLVLDDAESSGKSNHHITGTLTEFGINESGRYAIVQYDAVKLQSGKPIEKRRFEARRTVIEINAAEAGAALNEAANEVAIAIAKWTQ